MSFWKDYLKRGIKFKVTIPWPEPKTKEENVNILKKIWGWIVPITKNFLGFLLEVFQATAQDLAKKIPAEILPPIEAKIKELAKDNSISGTAKMKALKDYAVYIGGPTLTKIGQSALDTFLQNIYYGLKMKGIIK